MGVVPKHAKKEKTPPLYKQNIFREKKSAYIYIYVYSTKKKRHFQKSQKIRPPWHGEKKPLGIPGRRWRSQINALLLISLSFRPKAKPSAHFYLGCSQNCLKVQEKYRDPKTAAKLSLIYGLERCESSKLNWSSTLFVGLVFGQDFEFMGTWEPSNWMAFFLGRNCATPATLWR